MNRPTKLATGAAALLMSVTVTTQSGTPRQPAADAVFARYQTTPVATEAVTTSQFHTPPGKEWRPSRLWPAAGTKPTTFYMDGKGSAGGELATKKPAEAGSQTVFTVRYDVEAPGAQPRGPGLLTGAPPRPVEHGGPRFVTPALTSDTEVTGDALADLWMSSTATDGKSSYTSRMCRLTGG
jgi:predicted acyl esterase